VIGEDDSEEFYVTLTAIWRYWRGDSVTWV
jgi:hypothetical protein